MVPPACPVPFWGVKCAPTYKKWQVEGMGGGKKKVGKKHDNGVMRVTRNMLHTTQGTLHVTCSTHKDRWCCRQIHTPP